MSGDLFLISARTVGLAALATALMLPPGIALAWLLARRRFPGQALVETLVSLPLVLPPVATGLVLLQLLGRRGPLGSLLSDFGVEVLFTWKAVVVSMAVMGLPLLVRSARAGFEQIDRRYERPQALRSSPVIRRHAGRPAPPGVLEREPATLPTGRARRRTAWLLPRAG